MFEYKLSYIDMAKTSYLAKRLYDVYLSKASDMYFSESFNTGDILYIYIGNNKMYIDKCGITVYEIGGSSVYM